MAAVLITADNANNDEESGTFHCSISTHDGSTYVGEGSCTLLDTDSYSVKFATRPEGERNPTFHYSGQYKLSSLSVTGTCGRTEDVKAHNEFFLLKRTPSHVLRFRPSPSAFERNRYRSLWSYAIIATLCGVKRDRWSWSFFRERRDTRRKYIELSENFDYAEELPRCRQLLSYEDACFYNSLMKFGPGRLEHIRNALEISHR